MRPAVLKRNRSVLSTEDRSKEGVLESLKKHFSESESKKDFAERYIDYLTGLISAIDTGVIEKIIGAVETAGIKEKTIYFIGNGGSAATASHYANDISLGTRAAGHPHLKAISLTDNVALMTALGNDEGYNRIFARQLEGLVQPGDLLIALSVSGNSPNIIEAVEFAKLQGVLTVGITGFDGGRLHMLADIGLNVPTNKGEYGPAEDAFAIVGHLIGSYLKMDRRSRTDIIHSHPWFFENRNIS